MSRSRGPTKINIKASLAELETGTLDMTRYETIVDLDPEKAAGGTLHEKTIVHNASRCVHHALFNVMSSFRLRSDFCC